MTAPDAVPIYWATDTALRKLHADGGVLPRDVATEALARRYARDIDEASVISTQADKALRELARSGVDIELYDRIAALFNRIESTVILRELGPKLLATLAELGMTPRARADTVRKGGAPNERGNAPPSPLAQLRGERMARLKDA